MASRLRRGITLFAVSVNAGQIMAVPEVCPNCGAEVPRKAKACPECGACEETGWSPAAAISGLGLPDDEFDYDDFVKDEFGSGAPARHGTKWFWAVIAFLLAAILMIMLFWWK
jgi:ribosomal protein S27AE